MEADYSWLKDGELTRVRSTKKPCKLILTRLYTI